MPPPTKSQLVTMLQDVAAMLEFKGENPFKLRAYENAARAFAASPLTVDQLLADPHTLDAIPGIGKSTAHLISEVASTGTSEYLEQLRSEAPAGFHELLQIPHLGVKKIRVLFEKLAISGIEDLEVAAAEGKLAALPGFGARTVETILAGLRQHKSHSGAFLYNQGIVFAAFLVESLRECPDVERAEIVGSLRRRNETIHNIDLLAASERPAETLQWFATLPSVSHVLGSAPTSVCVMLTTAVRTTLTVVSADKFCVALQYLTGNHVHNEQLQKRADSLGLMLDEDGLHRRSDDHSQPFPVPVTEEIDLYSALQIPYIVPELREGLGEVQAAIEDKLPRLVVPSDYRGVLHVHSTWSDGLSPIEELALCARDEWGFEYLGVCDHSQAATYARGLREPDLARQHQEIDTLNSRLATGSFRILKGCESDILADGSLDYSSRWLDRMDFVVASVHSRFQMPHDEMTRRIVAAIQNPYTTIIGHLTGRILLGREGYSFDLEEVLRCAAETGTIVEINADPNRLDLDWRHCRRAREMGVKFAVNPDAHAASAFRHVQLGINIARKGWLEKNDIINCLSLDEFLARVRSIRETKLRKQQH